MTRRLLALVSLSALAATGWNWRWLAWHAGLVPARNVHGSVVFIVLDAVRADRTSLCGYARATTPNLALLVSSGATWTCRAYAPGTWTLPSHASFFTGLSPLEHGAHEQPAPDAGAAPLTDVPCAPLGTGAPTLASVMHDQGFTTVLLSQNPVVSEATGLTRGFDTAVTSESWHAWSGAGWPDRIEWALRGALDGEGERLFLFLNIADAHAPWWASAADEPFQAPTLFYNPRNPHGPWQRWYKGRMGLAERSDFVRNLGDAYDLGVWRADQALGFALDRLRELGLCGDDCRVVVTSDHGEMLGEHGMIDHGFVPWEENQRVPLLVAGPGAPPLPEPISGQEVFELVRTGALPTERLAVQAMYWPHAKRWEHAGGSAYGSRGAMGWAGTTKWTWIDGAWSRYALDVDSHELAPSSEVPPEGFRALAEAVEAVPMSLGTDANLQALLKAAGYAE